MAYTLEARDSRDYSLPTCLICSETFHEPAILQCKHNVCKGCVYKLTRSITDETAVSCPVCTQQTMLATRAYESASILGVNLFKQTGAVTNESSVYGDTSATEISAMRRAVCDTHNKQMKYYCTECSKALCQECSVTEHPKHHRLVDFRDRFTLNQKKKEIQINK